VTTQLQLINITIIIIIIHSYPKRLLNNCLQSEFWIPPPQVVALAVTPRSFQGSSYFTSGKTNIVAYYLITECERLVAKCGRHLVCCSVKWLIL